MATLTGGTLATTTLKLIQWYPGYQGTSSTTATDFATIKNGVMRDPGQPKGSTWGNSHGPVDARGNKVPSILPDGVSVNGLVTLPGGRGTIQLLPGDSIAIDQFGNVFVIPSRALPKTVTASVTVASGSPNVTSATDIRTYGWQVGTHVTSTSTPVGSVIGSILPTGLGFGLVAFATGLAANGTGSFTETMTAGTFTHS
jgi:hypothetical protein